MSQIRSYKMVRKEYTTPSGEVRVFWIPQEDFEGPRFRFEPTREAVPEHSDEMTELIERTAYVFENGLAPPNSKGGHLGNTSSRLWHDKCIISCSGIDKKELGRDKFAVVNRISMNGDMPGDMPIVYGYCVEGRKPSSEAVAHKLTYENRQDVSTITHYHYPVPIVRRIATMMGLRTTGEHYIPYGTSDHAQEIIKVIKDSHIFTYVWTDHGLVVMGSDQQSLDDITYIMEKIHEVAIEASEQLGIPLHSPELTTA